MKKSTRGVLLSNIFGTLGYFFCILAWSWVTLLYLPAVLENNYVEDFLIPTPAAEAPSKPVTTEMSPATMIFGVTVTVIVIIAMIIVLIKVPSTVAKTGKTVTTKAAETAVPLVTRGHQLPPAQKRRLTAKLIKLIKLLLVLLPVGATSLSVFIEVSLPYSVTLFVSSLLALISLVWFSAQYLIARLLHVEPAQLV